MSELGSTNSMLKLSSKRIWSLLAISLLLLPGTLALLVRPLAAQSQNVSASAPCGQSRLVQVRFLDGRPAAGVHITLSPSPPEMGGPAPYAGAALASLPGTITATPASATPGTECRPAINRTQSAVTGGQGLARFDGLGEGSWVLRFSGDISRGIEIGPIVSATIQGRAPYGRARQGGGFIERIDVLNEEGGPSQELVQPGMVSVTSRYLLDFSLQYGAWMPELDLASLDDASPMPISVVPSVFAPRQSATDTVPTTISDGTSLPSDRTVPDQVASAAAHETTSSPDSGVCWALLLCIALVGGALLALDKRRLRSLRAGESANVISREQDSE